MSIIMDDFEFLSREKNRHGREVIYVRRFGKRARIRETEGTAEFAQAYIDALASLGAACGGRRPTAAVIHTEWPKHTFGWLCTEYFKGKGEGEFLALSKDSQNKRRRDLEACLQVAHSDDDPDPMGNCPLKNLSAPKMKRLIEMKDGPEARTHRRKHLSKLCSWAVDQRPPLMTTNPVRDTRAGRHVRSDGYYTWTIPDVQQFIVYHREQATVRSRKAILALGLLLFAGMRRQDMVVLGKQHCRGVAAGTLGDWIRYVPKKTLRLRTTPSQKPLLPVLKQIILDTWDLVGDLTFLLNGFNKPFTEGGFSNWFRDRCDEAGLPQCTPHGLKKAGATIAAENGATTRQLMAMFDWTTPEMAEVYTRQAEQKRLAGEAMFLISLDRTENNDCRTSTAVGEK